MGNDSNPRFQFHFHNNIRMLGQSMYEGGLRIGSFSNSQDIDGELGNPVQQRSEVRKRQERLERYAAQVRGHQAELMSEGKNGPSLIPTEVLEGAASAEILRSVGVGSKQFVTADEVGTLSSDSTNNRVDASFDLILCGARAFQNAQRGIKELEAEIVQCDARHDIVKAQLLRDRLFNMQDNLEDLIIAQEMATVYSENVGRSVLTTQSI